MYFSTVQVAGCYNMRFAERRRRVTKHSWHITPNKNLNLNRSHCRAKELRVLLFIHNNHLIIPIFGPLLNKNGIFGIPLSTMISEHK